MTWMLIRLVLSLAFVGGVLWFAARIARKRGMGQANGLVEVVAAQRLGRASTVSVIRIADRVLVVGATEQTVTLLAEMDGEMVEATLADRELAAMTGSAPAGGGVPGALSPRRAPGGALAGSVFDRGSWGGFVQQMRERTVRR
ncbi:FliO/MopB family protein [Trujillonella endophytica]|uniref:Flagellar protein FliO/FliZ n=1 Tax=Trujillonella endophytica TaxID=673521 RepID=A0A1H8SIQ0_9ACTN|nr:flagellar biosynthetic protein FliO [Trujillella endophytica]SEO78437.1 flagellar protein FliO/FliZ [Trujillella endophytica]